MWDILYFIECLPRLMEPTSPLAWNLKEYMAFDGDSEELTIKSISLLPPFEGNAKKVSSGLGNFSPVLMNRIPSYGQWPMDTRYQSSNITTDEDGLLSPSTHLTFKREREDKFQSLMVTDIMKL